MKTFQIIVESASYDEKLKRVVSKRKLGGTVESENKTAALDMIAEQIGEHRVGYSINVLGLGSVKVEEVA